MSFATALGLLVSLLVVAPVVAHMLRRRRTETRAFPPARLVLSATPVARQRAKLEDRALFVIRALVVAALALLGATPFVRCSRLSVGRQGGGSVAMMLVVDDSMSMRAKSGGEARFARAIAGANELLSSLREGDAVAIVTAGAPARVALAATTDLGAARAALDALHESDRGTDLDGAISLASSLARSLPHPDRRVVLLSDLADGQQGPALGEESETPVWVPLPALRERLPDCGVVSAVRKGATVQVHVSCGAASDAEGRAVECVAEGGRVVGRISMAASASQELELSIEGEAKGALVARLTGSDAIAADDVAPVVAAATGMSVGVVVDVLQGGTSSGGPSPLEQAIGALDESIAMRPLSSVPDDPELLASFSVVMLDDPYGLTPEARGAFKTWLERGGVALLLLGPRAGQAILGESFDPFVPGPVRWAPNPPNNVDLASAGWFGATSEGLLNLAPNGRALLDARALEGAQPLARWSDGLPFALSRQVGEGEAIVATLPGGLQGSELPVRPAFLHLVDKTLEAGKARAVGRRARVGTVWPLRDPLPIKIMGPDGPIAPKTEAGGAALVAEKAGLYLIEREGSTEVRVAEIDEREPDLTPRPVAPAASSDALGTERASIDASPYVAFLLLAAIATESGLRLWTRKREAKA